MQHCLWEHTAGKQAKEAHCKPTTYDYANFFIYSCLPWHFSFASSDSWKLCRSSCKQYSACLWALDFPQNNENVRFISVHMLKCVNRTPDNVMLCWERKGKITKDTCLPFFQGILYIPAEEPPNERISDKINLKHLNYIIDFFVCVRGFFVVNSICHWHSI